MGSVRSINPLIELERFFDFIYGESIGYVYSPTLHPSTGSFEQYFFSWPTEKHQLLEHVRRSTNNLEVYYSPAFFSKREATKESFLGTYVLWAEFDGVLPATLGGVPNPGLKIQSSTENHEHWYWKLDSFLTDINVIEDITKKLAYYLLADHCAWNANRVLRPVGTRHHESGLDVISLRWDVGSVRSIAEFSHLPELPIEIVHDEDIKVVPAVLEVIAAYKWDTEDFKFFLTKEIPKGQRSSALTKIGHICMEMGMSNAETLSILLNTDSRWGKFSKRTDQRQRLLGIISYCRNRHPVDPIEEEAKSYFGKVYTYEEFRDTEIKLEWVVPGLIHKKGVICISGPPDVGKSQFSIRLSEKLARGEPFLKWSTTRPIRSLFVSMEMSHEELKYITDIMAFPRDELLDENFLILPIGSSVRLNNTKSQVELNKIIENYQPDGIWFDSLGVAISDDINSEKIILDTFDYIRKTLNGEYGLYTGLIHHHRKEQIGNKKPNSLNDLFGSTYIGAALTTSICLWPTGGPEIEVLNPKLRLAQKFDSFKIRRVPGLDFEVVEALKFDSKTPILGKTKEPRGFDLSDTI